MEVDRRLRQLRHQRRLPLRRGLPLEPEHHPGRPLALRRGVPGRARPQVRRPVHEGAEQLPGRLLPELRQLPLPVPLDPERPVHAVLVRRHGPQVLQPEGHDQPLPHGAHRRLHGCLLRRSVDAHPAPDHQPRAPLRPHERQVRSREGLRLPVLSGRVRQPHRPARPRLDRQRLQLQDVVPARRRELPADGGRQDGGASFVRPVLLAAHRRVPPKVRPRHAPGEPELPDVRGRAVELGRHQRRRDDRLVGDARGGPKDLRD